MEEEWMRAWQQAVPQNVYINGQVCMELLYIQLMLISRIYTIKPVNKLPAGYITEAWGKGSRRFWEVFREVSVGSESQGHMCWKGGFLSLDLSIRCWAINIFVLIILVSVGLFLWRFWTEPSQFQKHLVRPVYNNVPAKCLVFITGSWGQRKGRN